MITKDVIISKIALKMKKEKVSIVVLAEKCGVSRVTMANLTNKGEGKIDLLVKVCKVLRIKWQECLTG